VTDKESAGRSGRVGAWAALILGSAAIFIRVAAESHSIALGLLALAAFGAFMVGLVVWSRRRADRQIESSVTTGQLRVELGLDFECLPGDWPERSRETLNAAGAGSTPSLPVILTADGGRLIIEKRRGFWLGRSAFHAEIATANVTGVRVASSMMGIAGSSIVIQLRSGEEVRGDLPVPSARAEVIAERIRALMGGVPPTTNGSAIQITSPPPPVRTPPGRAGLLMMASLPPFMVAMAGAEHGPVAATTSLFALLYGLWLMMRRPVNMPKKIGVALAVTACAFLIDAVGTGESLRLIGAFVAGGLAWWVMSSRRAVRATDR
jgi:hypothetical protein